MIDYESKIHEMFHKIISTLETFIDSSNTDDFIYDTLIKIYKSILSLIKSSDQEKHLSVLSQYEKKLQVKEKELQYFINENNKYKDRENQLMQFEKDILLFNDGNSKELSIKRLVFHAKNDIKKLKNEFKIKELNYLMTIQEQQNTINEHQNKVQQLQNYIRNNITKFNSDLSKRKFLFPYLYDKEERDELNVLKKMKSYKKLFTSHSIETFHKKVQANSVKHSTMYVDRNYNSNVNTINNYTTFGKKKHCIINESSYNNLTTIGKKDDEMKKKNSKIKIIKRILGNNEMITMGGNEYIRVWITSDGVTAYEYCNELKEVNVTTEAANLLDFNSVNEMAKSCIMEYANNYGTAFNIDKIVLGYATVEENGKYSIIPAWYYFMDDGDENEFYTFEYPVVVVNALDGTKVELVMSSFQ